MLVNEFGYAEVHYDEEDDVVIGRLKNFTSGEEFREYMDGIINAVEDHDTTRVLADTSEFDAALSQDDQEWSVVDWAPRAEDAGVESLALVMPENVVAKMSVDSVMNMADDNIARDVFDDRGDAEAWLTDR